MTSDKFFRSTLIISALAHISFIAVQLPKLDFIKKNRRKTEINVVYLKNVPPPPQYPKGEAAKRPLARIPPKVTAADTSLLDALKKNPSTLKNKSEFAVKEPAVIKPFTLKPDTTPAKKKITLPPVEMSKITNPSYINYYQLVREQIRRSAYQGYSRTETGEIYISFLIMQDGTLRDIKLIEDRSTPSYYLRDIAVKSVKAAAPFKAFPNDLNYQQLSFNVIISFEIE